GDQRDAGDQPRGHGGDEPPAQDGDQQQYRGGGVARVLPEFAAAGAPDDSQAAQEDKCCQTGTGEQADPVGTFACEGEGHLPGGTCGDDESLGCGVDGGGGEGLVVEKRTRARVGGARGEQQPVLWGGPDGCAGGHRGGGGGGVGEGHPLRGGAQQVVATGQVEGAAGDPLVVQPDVVAGFG